MAKQRDAARADEARADAASVETAGVADQPAGGPQRQAGRPARVFEPAEGDKGTRPEKPAGYHKVGAPLRWADDLIRELAASGTGQDKLDVIRRAKAEKFERVAVKKYGHTKDERAARDPECHLSAEEAVLVLEDDDRVGEGTRAKARALLESGEWTPRPAPGTAPADAHLPPPPDAGPPPVAEEYRTDAARDGTNEPAPAGDTAAATFPGPRETGRPGDPGTGQRPLDRHAPGVPASADAAALGKGHEPGPTPGGSDKK